MRTFIAFALLFSMHMSSKAMAQAYNFSTNSTEMREILSSAVEFHGLNAYLYEVFPGPSYARVTQTDKIQPVTDLMNSNGCMPRGALLTQLGPVGLSMSYSRRHYGILRKGQSISIEIKLCSDVVDRDLPVFVPDVTTSGVSGGFSKNTDAKVSLVGPNGSILPLNGIYYNRPIKQAYRGLVLRAIQSGSYKLLITGGSIDLNVDATFELRSSGTQDVDTNLFAPQPF